MVRCVDELSHGARLRVWRCGLRGATGPPVADGDAFHWQGDRPATCPVLAGIPDVSRPPGAAAHRAARLVYDGRGEDVEVARQCRALPGLRRSLWTGRTALLRHARDAARS